MNYYLIKADILHISFFGIYIATDKVKKQGRRKGMSESTNPIVLLTHNGWGKYLLESIKMIAGEVNDVYEVALYPQDSLDDFLLRVKELIESLQWKNKLLVLTDLKGGTTSNVALRLSKDYELVTICGLCAPLLLEAVSRQHNGGFTLKDAEEIHQISLDSCSILDVVISKGDK